MSSRGSNWFRSPYGRGGTSRGSLTSTRGARSASSGGGDEVLVPSGDLVVTIHATDILPSGGSAKMSDFQCIASYNWLDSSKPIILVPGSPAVWSPPLHRRRLDADKGEVFIDQNAARYKSYPLEPAFRAIYVMHPGFDLKDVDVVICRNTVAKLFDFVTQNSRSFEIDVQIIGGQALFIRKEKKTTEFIEEFRGYGYAFPEEYTRWDSAVKGSSSHHRIAEYDFAGLKYLLRFESDGYLAEKAGGGEKASSWRQEGEANVADTTSLLSSDKFSTLDEKRPVTGPGLVVRNGGSEIDQGAAIDIKTRAAHKVLDMESVLPRLWMSQTPNLIAAYHKGGRFDDVQVLHVGKDLEKWEERNSMNLQKLDAVIRRIIDTVQNTTTKKCRVRRTNSGTLEIWELDISQQSALPDDLCEKLKEKGPEDENDRSRQTGQGSPGRDSGEGHDDFEDDFKDDFKDDHDYDDGDDESEKDYTACSSEECGYCGHCDY